MTASDTTIMETSANSSPMKVDLETKSLHLWYFHDKSMKKATLEQVDLSGITVRSLKEIAVQNKPEQSFTDCADDIDVLYNGSVLPDSQDLSLESLKVKPNSVLHIIKKVGTISEKKDKEFEEFQKHPLKVISRQVISELATALKTMILSPAFYSAVDDLSDPKTLKAVLAAVPNLKYDPVGIAIIQDPSMILYLADEDSLKNLALTRPWVIEAFNVIAAGIHQQEATSRGKALPRAPSRTPGLHSFLSYMRQLYDEDGEEIEFGGPRASGSGASGGPPPQITRQHLEAALASFTNLQRGAGSSQGPSTSRSSSATNAGAVPNPFRLFGPGPTVRPPTQTIPAPTPSAPTGAAGTPPPLSGEMVARAMREALNQLPPEQRTAQFNALRNLAMTLNQQGTETAASPARSATNVAPPRPPPARTPAPAAVTPPPSQNSSGTSLASVYQEQLAQMREMGIFDERLSIMALRLSEGDVSMAVDLIFSGWQGEGLE